MLGTIYIRVDEEGSRAEGSYSGEGDKSGGRFLIISAWWYFIITHSI